MSTRSVFKAMMREAEKFSDYNFRRYAQRRIRDGFREPAKPDRGLEFARQNLEMMRRQVRSALILLYIYI